jgi:hypothetical protein
MTDDEWCERGGLMIRMRAVRVKAVSSLRFATAVQGDAGC